MILDSRNEFCDAVACNTGAAGTYLIGSQIPLGLAHANGAIDDLYLVISVDTGIEVASSTGTIQFKLASDDSASIATDGSATVHLTTPAFATSTTTDTTTLKAGTVLYVAELPKSFDYEAYLGILQVTGTTAISAGKINAFLTTDPAMWRAYDAPASA
jgi:hypothetical protein